MTHTVRDNRPITRRADTSHPATPRRAPKRNDRGLTTLEWLLIVAAVAGLAALAVVLVQNVVDDTAEQIAGSSARLTAAEVAAAQITADVNTTTGASDRDDAKAKCNRLQITYSVALAEAGKKPKYTEGATSPNTNDKCEIVDA